MSNTRKKTIEERYGKDFWRRIGREGGKKSRGGSFRDPDVASAAGKKSKRKSLRLE